MIGNARVEDVDLLVALDPAIRERFFQACSRGARQGAAFKAKELHFHVRACLPLSVSLHTRQNMVKPVPTTDASKLCREMDTTKRLGIGALSELSGVNIETIRYYERAGLLPAPPRTAGGHRSYSSDHFKRLTFIRRSRRLGFSTDEVRGLLSLVNSGSYTCGEVHALTMKHLDDVRRKIADLRRMEKSLVEISSACEGGAAPECPIIETLRSSDDRALQRE